jgi:hypothetical protein
MDGDVHLGRSALVRAAAQPVTDHLLEPTDGRFDASADGVAGRLLPGRSSALGDELQMASRCVGAVSAVSLGTAVEHGGTMTAASG